ncbi:hypothetical protein YC2023_008707 [Brassica napus]
MMEVHNQSPTPVLPTLQCKPATYQCKHAVEKTSSCYKSPAYVSPRILMQTYTCNYASVSRKQPVPTLRFKGLGPLLCNLDGFIAIGGINTRLINRVAKVMLDQYNKKHKLNLLSVLTGGVVCSLYISFSFLCASSPLPPIVNIWLFSGDRRVVVQLTPSPVKSFVDFHPYVMGFIMYAAVAVVGCGSTDRVSDLEMEVHQFRVLGELLSKEFGRLNIQGVWTELRFPLSSYEVSGSWSYRLVGKAAAISVVCVQKWRLSGGGLWAAVIYVFLNHSGVGLSHPSVDSSYRFLGALGSGAISFCHQVLKMTNEPLYACSNMPANKRQHTAR